jgi:hypothetical protein
MAALAQRVRARGSLGKQMQTNKALETLRAAKWQRLRRPRQQGGPSSYGRTAQLGVPRQRETCAERTTAPVLKSVCLRPAREQT